MMIIIIYIIIVIINMILTIMSSLRLSVHPSVRTHECILLGMLNIVIVIVVNENQNGINLICI